ncbi:hypothetical protein OG470_09275 [Micromonospora sp. NBC_00389]
MDRSAPGNGQDPPLPSYAAAPSALPALVGLSGFPVASRGPYLSTDDEG